MIPHQRRTNPYIQRMVEDMQVRNFAESTIDSTMREDYLRLCRQLLPPPDRSNAQEEAPAPACDEGTKRSLKCPRCQTEMICIARRPRPSWREVFDRRGYSSHPGLLLIHGIERIYVPDD